MLQFVLDRGMMEINSRISVVNPWFIESSTHGKWLLDPMVGKVNTLSISSFFDKVRFFTIVSSYCGGIETFALSKEVKFLLKMPLCISKDMFLDLLTYGITLELIDFVFKVVYVIRLLVCIIFVILELILVILRVVFILVVRVYC